MTADNMRTIRASEIGTFLYCKRAWMYRIQGAQSENMAEMAYGKNIHIQHGRAVLAAGCLRYLAYGLMLASLMLAVVYFTIQII